jgi:hypothetical protein
MRYEPLCPPPRVVVVAAVEVPRNASRAQIERPHQSGGDSADLVVSQGEVRRIYLPRTPVNKGEKRGRSTNSDIGLHNFNELLRPMIIATPGRFRV